ncbi:carboxymuconolactone decarboxylase family protein [Microbacterium sp. 69-10]|uniref:carboxymuconolactone decarboxylase family protein n=1 Tax=Microbacterium sp. 69-10 TaxID=1895783 RepID=UPI00267AE73F
MHSHGGDLRRFELIGAETTAREGLSKRDRSLITVAALTATGKMDQLTFHLVFARENGVTDEELQEALLQLAFYTGWPNGMGATAVLKSVVEGLDQSHPCTPRMARSVTASMNAASRGSRENHRR